MNTTRTDHNRLGFVTAKIIGLATLVGLCSSDPAALAANPYLVSTFVEDGRQIDQIVVPGRPPLFRAQAVSVPSPRPAAGVNSLSNVPAFTWVYGCSATSAGMMMGYYDNQGYGNMYAGPANGGVCPLNNETFWGHTSYPGVTCGECPMVASHNGIDGRVTRGHVDDYWIDYNNPGPDPYIVNGWSEHSGDCTADFMGTNQSKYGNSDGSTTFFNYTDGSPLYDYTGHEPGMRDGCRGLKLFVISRGYAVSANFSQYIYGYNGNTLGFTYAAFKSEIDAGRPVMIQVEGHSMVGFGYNDAGNTIYIHDTWDNSDHSMTWGGSYSGMQHYGVTVLRLQAAVPEVTVAATDGTAGEPGTGLGSGMFTFTRTGSTAAALTVNYTVSGTATSGTDYTAIPSPVTFAAGSATATKTVSVLDENMVESTETVGVTLAAGTGYTVGSPSAATVTIADDDATVTVAATDALASEPGGVEGTGTFTFTRSGYTAGALSVSYTVGGTATSGTDYTAIPSPVVFAAGATTATKTVTALADAASEVDETVLVTLGAGTGYAVGSPASATVTIKDTAPTTTTVTVAATDATAGEPGTGLGSGTFTFTRTGSTTAALTVNYTVSGTATGGTDYTAIPSPVTFAAGSPTATKTVSVIDDAVAECTEWVDVTLAAGTGYTVGTPSSVTVTIADDDLPQVSVAPTDAVASEPGGVEGTGTFTFTRIGCLSGPLTVSFTVGGTATGGSDYTSIGTTAAFDAGSATTMKTVTALADFLIEADETLVLTLAAGAGYGVGSPGSATVTIKDVPPPCQNWVTAFTAGTLRNNAAAWRGLRLRTGATAVGVHELGRVYLNGNVQSHEVALFHATTGAKVASVVWTPTGGTHNQIKYVALAAPVVLAANTEYYLASWEVSGGDSLYSSDTVLTTSGAATVLGAAYNAGSAWATLGSPGNSYGPVSLVWCSSAGAGAEWPEPEEPLMELVIHLPDMAEPEYAGAFAIVPGQEYVLEALTSNGDWVAVGALTGQPGVLEVVDVTGLVQGALAYQLVIAPQPETADPDE